MSRRPFAVLAVLLLLGAGAFALARSGRAEDSVRAYEMRFLSISGAGSSATAWFEGAPASGLRVQEALSRCAQEGFRLSGVAPAWRATQVTVGSTGSSATTAADPQFVLVLERNR